jgi:hypothetical protein
MMMMADGMTTNNTGFGTVGTNPPIRKPLVVPRQHTTLDAPNGLTGKPIGSITQVEIPPAFQPVSVAQNTLNTNSNQLFTAGVFQAAQPSIVTGAGSGGYKFAQTTTGQATVEANGGVKENNRRAALNQVGVASGEVVSGVGATPWG